MRARRVIPAPASIVVDSTVELVVDMVSESGQRVVESENGLGVAFVFVVVGSRMDGQGGEFQRGILEIIGELSMDLILFCLLDLGM